MKLRTFGMIATGGLIVFGLLYTTFKTDPVPVSLHEIVRGSMQVTIDADGKTQIRDIFEVAAPISGIAKRSPVKVGDTVIADETVVAIVEPVVSNLLDQRSRLQAEAGLKEAEAALDVAQSDLTRTDENLDYAQTQFDRIKTLVDRGVSTLTQLEDAEQRLSIAKAAKNAALSRVAMSRGALERAAATLIEPHRTDENPGACCVTLMSPADGVVLNIDMISERPVSAGTRLLSIGDPAQLEIVADVLSADTIGMTPGTRAIVERWGGAAPLEAVLRRVEPSARTKISALGIEEQRVDAVFDLLSPIEDRPSLGDGFSVYMRIIEWQADDVVQIPLSAIFRKEEQWLAYVVVNDIAMLRRIELGRRNGRFAEVKNGLEIGEIVITHPSDDIADGIRVSEREIK